MQNVVSEICDIIKSNELKDIVILTPSQVLSKRLVALCAKREKVMLGVTGSTPLLFAKEVCAPVLYAKAAPTLMEKGQVEDVVLDCLNKAIGKGVFYHSKERATAAIMKDIIAELDENCVDNKELIEKVNNARTEAIATIRQAYEEAKQQENLWDNADVLKEAVEQLKNTKEFENTIFITLSCFKFSKLEELLVAQLNKVSVIDVNIPEVQAVAEKAEGFKCRSTEVEVRRILKDILEKDHPADDCAVVYLTSDYADALLSECELYGINASIYGGVSFTSNRYYHMYKVLQEWKKADFDAELLYGLVKNSALPIKNSNDFCSLLRKYNSGWGRDRYDVVLTLAKQEAGEALKKKEQFDATTDEEEQKKLKLNGKEWLLTSCHENIDGWKDDVALLIKAASEEGDLNEQKNSLLAVLEGVNKKDAAAFSIIKKTIKSITILEPGETALGRLLLLLQATTYRSQSEGSGKLLCVPLKQAFFTGRNHLYICGFSRFALQGNRNESPLLLDTEKKALKLPTLVDLEEENNKLLNLLLNESYAVLQLSYNYFDTEKMIELQPAPMFGRLIANKAVKHVDYIEDGDDYIASDWVKKYKTTDITLPEYMAAESEGRQELASNPSYIDFIKDRAYSASAIETALGCPLKFFLTYVLGLSPYEAPRSDDDRWLQANEIGTLCHTVLELYYANDDVKIDACDDKLVEKLLDAEVEKMKQTRPLATQAAMEADKEIAKATIYRAIEWTRKNVTEIIHTEYKFGEKYGKPKVIVDITSNLKLSILGSIDRLEKRGDKVYVLDYKTGKKFDPNKDKTKIQPFIYSLAAENQNVAPRIYGSGYLFINDNQNNAVVASVDQNEAQSGITGKIIEDLFKNWLFDIQKTVAASNPAFAIDDNGNITGEGDAKAKEDAEKNKLYCRYCSFKDFCQDNR